MLSIVDLIDAQTVSIDLAGYLLAAIGQGTSFLVGANPGGAGKTTVMGALLNFVPADVSLVPTDRDAVVRRGLEDTSARRCYICHEIGAGHWYAYLWGSVLADLFALPSVGHMVATNLHADTLEEARDQLCRDNPVPEESFHRFGLMLFLDVRGGWGRTQRTVAAVHEATEPGPPRRVYTMTAPGSIERDEPSSLVTAEEHAGATKRIEALYERRDEIRAIDEVRAFLVGA